MFQKCSFSVPSDLSGALLVKVIQTRRCNSRRHAGITKFLRVVIRNCRLILNKKAKRKI